MKIEIFYFYFGVSRKMRNRIDNNACFEIKSNVIVNLDVHWVHIG